MAAKELPAPSWLPLPGRPELPAGEVHVWRAALAAGDAGFVALERLLSPEERRRAWRLRREEDRRRWILSRGILRSLLGRYLDAEPASLRFSLTARGKPFLAHPPAGAWLRFNLSHAGELALFAFCRGRELGVDVEPVRPLAGEEALAARVFSRGERDELALLPEARRWDGFFAGWTRKEAYLKATGDGLVDDLERVEVSLAPEGPALLRALRGDAAAGAGWSFFALDPAEGYAGALVVEGRGVRLRLWDA